MVATCKEGGLMMVVRFVRGGMKMYISETRSFERFRKNPYLLGILFDGVCPPSVLGADWDWSLPIFSERKCV